jgi:hypothetical protein
MRKGGDYIAGTNINVAKDALRRVTARASSSAPRIAGRSGADRTLAGSRPRFSVDEKASRVAGKIDYSGCTTFEAMRGRDDSED